jgi:hypothetical protein
MLTRSTSTPGTLRISANGSREVGTFCSSFDVKLVAVPVALLSTMGDSPVTVTVSSTAATFMAIGGTSTFAPTRTSICSRIAVANPDSVSVNR